MIRSRNPSIVAARDVKPGHVIVLPDGTIKTLDDVKTDCGERLSFRGALSQPWAFVSARKP